MKDFIAILVIAFILPSCKNGSVARTVLSQDYEDITVDARGMEYKASELFIESRVVELETTSESYLASVGRIYQDERYIYVLDNRMHSILIFTKDGTFVKRIIEMGRGPGEYIQLNDYAVGHDGEILLLADIPEKMIIQSQKGDLIEQIQLDKSYLDFAIKDDVCVLVNPPTSKYSFSFINLANGQIRNIQDQLPEYNNIYTNGDFATSTENQIVLTRRFDKVIYSYEDSMIVEKSGVRFNEGGFITQNELGEIGSSKYFFDICRKRNCVFTITDCQKVGGVWIFNTNLPNCYLYSTHSGKSYTISVLKDNQYNICLGGYTRVAVNGKCDNEMCFVVKDLDLRQFGKTEADNPLLIFYRLRDDL